MAFSIDLLEKLPSVIGSEKSPRWGLIKIGSYEERFVAAMDYWDVADYRRHWQQALNRIIKTSSTSGLITSISDPTAANFIYWWPMYRVGDTVHFQNHILFLDELENPFDPDDPYRFVPERTVVNQDAEAISEWSAPIAALESFSSNGWPLHRGTLR